jgi:hypothetical protein
MVELTSFQILVSYNGGTHQISNFRFLQWRNSPDFKFYILTMVELTSFQILDSYNGGTHQNVRKCLLD